MSYRPPRPTGTSREARFMQWVYDELNRLQPSPSVNNRVEITPQGFTFSGKKFELLPMREMEVCERLDNGTTRTAYVKVHCSQLYYKDAAGNITSTPP